MKGKWWKKQREKKDKHQLIGIYLSITNCWCKQTQEKSINHLYFPLMLTHLKSIKEGRACAVTQSNWKIYRVHVVVLLGTFTQEVQINKGNKIKYKEYLPVYWHQNMNCHNIVHRENSTIMKAVYCIRSMGNYVQLPVHCVLRSIYWSKLTELLKIANVLIVYW